MKLIVFRDEIFCLGLVPPIEPFHTRNRFTTAAVFGILAFEVLKIFEQILLGSWESSNNGVLIEVIMRMAIVMITGYVFF